MAGTRYIRVWLAGCLDCNEAIPPGGEQSDNPKFGWARKHTRETGHQTIIRKVETWRMTADEEA